MNKLESERLSLQRRLDAQKSQVDRNQLGQFSTPTALAREIVEYGLSLLASEQPIRFLDPAFGTGSFFSALLDAVPRERIEAAWGVELDVHYGEPSRKFWQNTPIELELADFTKLQAPRSPADRFNFLLCNPPYVRHHHLAREEKSRLQKATEVACGMHVGGLAGLYCYFLGLSHPWLRSGGVAGWLIPSEFMNVNYGGAIEGYLLDRVTLLRIHRFDPTELQFQDALVSSAVVWLQNNPPPANWEVQFTFGGSLFSPQISRSVPTAVLRQENKWTRFPVLEVRSPQVGCQLSDLFAIKRGLATGDNAFFILTGEQIEAHSLPHEVFRPILPSPRYLSTDIIEADAMGLPLLERQLFLLDCRLPEVEIRQRYPQLWSYLEKGRETVSKRYLCRTRKVWYFQEKRPPAPIVCTYLGRGNARSGKTFRFILNRSLATAANVYLLLYPKPGLARLIERDSSLLGHMWSILNNLSPSSLLEEGRVYGGGLHKLEPKELGKIDATPLIDVLPESFSPVALVQTSLFDT